MRTIEQQRTEWPLAGHRGWCHKVQTAQFAGHFKGKCDCGEQLRQNLEFLRKGRGDAFDAVLSGIRNGRT